MTRSASPADDKAAAWVARLDRFGTDERDHPELLQWLEADSRHRGAFIRARAVWQMVAQDGSSIAGPVTDALARGRDDAATRQTATSATPATSATSTAAVTRRAMVAGMAGVAVAGSVMALTWAQPAAATIMRTGFGEIRRYAFAGGGSLVLDGASEVRVHGAAMPRVDLVRGGAWMDLPLGAPTMTIFNGQLQCEAAGASLALRHAPVPEIIVGRGFIDVRDHDRGTTRIGTFSRVRRGDDAIMRIDQVSPAALDRLLAWRSGDVDLDGETVAAAAARFNAYNRQSIVVTDRQLAAQRVVGRFALHRPDDFAAAVATMFGGRVARVGEMIRIDRTNL